jgi:hypothetical protein
MVDSILAFATTAAVAGGMDTLRGAGPVLRTQPNAASDWLPAIAVVGSFCVSALALWIAHRSRHAALRDQLHLEQSRVLASHMYLILRIGAACVGALEAPESETRKKCREEAEELEVELQRLASTAAVMLPSGIAGLLSHYVKLVRRVDSSEDAARPTGEDIHQCVMALLGQIRAYLGVDALSADAISLIRSAARVRPN